MIETIKGYLSHAWIRDLSVSILWLVVVFFFGVFGRKGLKRLKIEPERQGQIRRWFMHLLWIIYGLLLIKIWAVSDLFSYLGSPVISKLIRSTIAFAIVYGAFYFLRSLINSLKLSLAEKHAYRKRISYLATLIYILIIIPIWAGTTQQWATVLSVMGAGIALALHEMLLNIAGWIYIIIRHPYRTGDRIEINDLRGDVIDIRIFETSLLEIGNWVDGDQSTGRLVHMPHGQIFRNPLYNYTQGFEYIWNEMPILLTFESNWEKAKEILLGFGEELSHDVQRQVKTKIDKMAKEYLIYYKNFTSIVYVKIEDSGVKLTLRYLTDIKKRREGENLLAEKMLQAFEKEPDIEFAYPTYRLYKRPE